MTHPAADLKSPFPYFGGKHSVAAEVWRRFGNPANYIEPFAGSLAVLLARPHQHQWWDRNETVNDIDAHIANWHRAVAADPATVARHASAPVNETDLTARHLWLVQNADQLRTDLLADPDHYDPRAAGWWVWGISAWVGGEWCSGLGPHTGHGGPNRAHGGTAPGVYRKMPMISGAHSGKGIHRPLRGIHHDPTDPTPPPVAQVYQDHLTDLFSALADRMRRVRVASGDWSRVLNNAAIAPRGSYTAVFLDPPYDPTERRTHLYAVDDHAATQSDTALDLGLPAEASVHEQARSWAIERGTNPAYRIAYCSYSTPHEDALFTQAGWHPYRWTAQGGYALAASATTRARTNRDREIIWFSPTTTAAEQHDEQQYLFDTPERPAA